MRCLKVFMYNVFGLVGKVAYLSVKVGTKNETKKSEKQFGYYCNTSATIKRSVHLVLGLNEGLVECVTVCVKSEVILNFHCLARASSPSTIKIYVKLIKENKNK